MKTISREIFRFWIRIFVLVMEFPGPNATSLTSLEDSTNSRLRELEAKADYLKVLSYS
ncbi:hypothetical protein KKB99_02105 [bacterium]|nr:hypothetical protein [bacterium]MBU1024780.1 hypothetical protein [bacterium]